MTLKYAMISNDHRTDEAIIHGATVNGIQLDFVSHVDYFYPSIKYLDFNYGQNKFFERGRYFDLLLKALYRDFKISWRYLDTDAEFWYFFIKNKFSEVIDQYDGVIFSNVPHEGLDIILADLAEDLGKKWFAPLQCMNGEPAFQIFTNGFKKIENSESLRILKPKKVPIGVRHEKENSVQIKKFRRNITNPPLFEKLFDRIARSHRKLTQPKINTILNEGEKYGLLALHMQPELTTEPLAGKFANPITWLETLCTMFPEIHWVVKEHPDRSDRYRGNYFAKYLLDNISRGRFSYLSDKSKIDFKNFDIVSTINGTVGIEALSFGIPVVCHSSAFYSDVPGVILIDKKNIISNEKLAKLKVGELKSNFLFGGLTEPYSLSLYGSDQLNVGWRKFFSECVSVQGK